MHADGSRTVQTICTGRSVVEALVIYRAVKETRAQMVVEDELDKIANDG